MTEEKIKCDCGTTWQREPELKSWAEEEVLICIGCGKFYFNAEKDFSEETLSKLDVREND